MKLFGSNRNGRHGAPHGGSDSPYTENPVERDDTIVSSGYDSARGEEIAPGKLPDGGEMPDGKKRRNWRRIAVIALGCVVLLCVTVYAAVQIFVEPPDQGDETGLKIFTSPTPKPSTTPGATPGAAPGAHATPKPTTGRKEDTYTFIALGRDYVGGNTDTIMVGKLDTAEGTLNICSIPRDTLVNVPWGNRKANGIWFESGYYHNNQSFEGDFDRMKEYFAELLGFEPDKYILLNLKAVEEIIDAVDGVDYDVPRDMYWDAPDQNLHIAINKGFQHLTGAQALQVLRFRVSNSGGGYADGDLGRINTQQDLLMTAAKQILTVGNIPNVSKIYQSVRDNVETDLSDNNLAFYVTEFLKLDSENIKFMTVPNDGVYIRNGSYVSVRLEEWLDMVNEYLNPFYDEVTEGNVNILMSKNGASFTSTTGNVPTLESFIPY